MKPPIPKKMNNSLEASIQLLRSALRAHRLDAVLISSPSNIVYYSGFAGFSRTERDGYLLITHRNGYILTNPLYADEVKHRVQHLSLLISSKIPMEAHFDKIVKKHRLRSVGFESYDLTVAEYNKYSKILPGLQTIDLRGVRNSKSVEEITHITRASRIADNSLLKILPMIRPGMTEKTVVKLLEDEIRHAESETAFPTIVAFGKNASVPHHKSNNTILKKNDLILIDFGATSNEYRSDMTRTFFMGNPTDEQKAAYDAVLSAQQQAVQYIQTQLLRKSKKTISPQIPASHVDNKAREYLISHGYPPIPHSLGHGIGLEVHEAPSLSPRSHDMLTEGMVFSIEPGVYLPGKFGIRIEDLYTIQNGKLRQLTKTPKNVTALS